MMTVSVCSVVWQEYLPSSAAAKLLITNIRVLLLGLMAYTLLEELVVTRAFSLNQAPSLPTNPPLLIQIIIYFRPGDTWTFRMGSEGSKVRPTALMGAVAGVVSPLMEISRT